MPRISFRDCWIRDDVFALPANVSFSFSQFIDNYVKLLRETLHRKETIISFLSSLCIILENFGGSITRVNTVDLLRVFVYRVYIRRCVKRLNARTSRVCYCKFSYTETIFLLFDLCIAYRTKALFCLRNGRRVHGELRRKFSRHV